MDLFITSVTHFFLLLFFCFPIFAIKTSFYQHHVKNLKLVGSKLLDLLNKAHNKRLDDQRGLIDANSLEIPEFLLSSNSTTPLNENLKNISSSSSSSSASSSPLNIINNNKILTRVTNLSRSRSPIIFLNDELDEEEEEEVEKKSKYSIYNDLIVVDKKLEENCNYDDSSQVSYV